jgi:hypothetical protein
VEQDAKSYFGHNSIVNYSSLNVLDREKTPIKDTLVCIIILLLNNKTKRPVPTKVNIFLF